MTTTTIAGIMVRFPSDWIEYAHGPGADSGQPTAIELMERASKSRTVWLSDKDAHLVREIRSVASLYAGGYCYDAEERARSRRAQWIIRRCDELLTRLPR